MVAAAAAPASPAVLRNFRRPASARASLRGFFGMRSLPGISEATVAISCRVAADCRAAHLAISRGRKSSLLFIALHYLGRSVFAERRNAEKMRRHRNSDARCGVATLYGK